VGTLVAIAVIALAGPTLGTHAFSALEPTEEQDPNQSEGGKSVTLAVSLGPELAPWVRPGDHLEVVDAATEPGEDKVLAWATRRADGQVEIRYNGEDKRSKWARGRIHKVVKRRNRQVADEAWSERGHALPRAELMTWETHWDGSDDELADLSSSMVPMILTFTLLMAGMGAAAESFIGERENETMESLLVTPISRRAIVAAKTFVVFAVAAAGGVLTVAGIALAGASQEALLTSPKVLGYLALCAVAMAGQVTALLTCVAAYASSYRAYSFLMSPIMIVLALASWAPGFLPDIELSWAVALVPVVGIAHATNQALEGTLSLQMGALVMGSAFLVGVLALGASTRFWGREDVLVGTVSGAERRQVGDYSRDALATYLLVWVLMLMTGLPAQAMHPVWGLVFTLVVVFGGTALLGWLYSGADASILRLHRPEPRNLALAIVAGLSGVGVAGVAGGLQNLFFTTPDGIAAGFQPLLDLPLWQTLVIAALLPGLFEEFLFRGVLLGMVRERLGTRTRWVVVNLGFALIHLSYFRFFPVFCIGLLVTAAAMRSRSTWSAVVVHGTYNATLLTAASYGAGELPEMGLVPSIALTAALSALSLGAVWLMRPAPE